MGRLLSIYYAGICYLKVTNDGNLEDSVRNIWTMEKNIDIQPSISWKKRMMKMKKVNYEENDTNVDDEKKMKYVEEDSTVAVEMDVDANKSSSSSRKDSTKSSRK